MPQAQAGTNVSLTVAVVLGTLLLAALAVWVITFLVFYRRRQQQFMREKELLLSRFEQELQLVKLEVQEETHRQIASEIHDNVGQLLSVVRLYQSGLIEQLANEAQRRRLTEANEITGRAIADLRALSHAINTDFLLKQSLAEILRSETERITRSGTFTAGFSTQGEIPELPPETTLIVCRMTQELLQNAIRHSAGNHIDIKLERKPHQLHISVTDNGHGMPRQPAKGSGTDNLQRRAGLIGATVVHQPASARGTAAFIILPLP
ncbi:MAG: ATP-binding protein [Bacteroidia bacterium]|jgi:signal transduction histidine kinase|nr:ATP-binding protein [Bacteroidia bacterium]